jgi:hypothetical protein
MSWLNDPFHAPPALDGLHCGQLALEFAPVDEFGQPRERENESRPGTPPGARLRTWTHLNATPVRWPRQPDPPFASVARVMCFGWKTPTYDDELI